MMLRNQIRMDSDLVGEVRQDAGDTFDLNAPILTPEGYHRFDGRITRSGILKYRNGDKVRVEYRPPDEVQKALDAMNGLPITLTHKAGLLTGENAKQNSIGATLSPRFDGKWVSAQHIVYNVSDVAKMKAESLRQTSQGYTVDYDPTPGVTPEGVRYDGVQRNIRPNHQAMVKKARAGHECSVRLDGAFAADTTETTENPMFKHADGTEFASQAALDAYSKVVDQRDELKGRLDHADARGTEDAINARIKERRKLERAAETLQTDDKRLDGIEDLSDKDLMIAAIKLHDASFNGEGMPAGEVRGWFKAMVASHANKPEPAPVDDNAGTRQDAGDKPEPTAPTSEDPRKKKKGKHQNGMFLSNEERKRLLAK